MLDTNTGYKSFLGCITAAIVILLIFGIVIGAFTGDISKGIKFSGLLVKNIIGLVVSGISIIIFLFFISKVK